MLLSLHIYNYAIIREVEIRFDGKLNIITGETGAGKSILIGALGLILGERADTKVLMNTEEKCTVEGSFNIKGYNLKAFFEENELDYDSICLLRREIAPNGKSRAFINDTPVNLNQLKELGSQLIDVVSQHQTLALNENAFQLSIVDSVAETEKELTTYEDLFHKYKKLSKQLADLREQEAKARTDEDYFRFLLNELVEAKLEAQEQQTLEENLDTLSHAETIQQAASESFRSLDENEQSITDQLNHIKSVLSAAAKHHTELKDLATRIDSTLIELKDISAELERIAEQTQADPVELERTEQRLQLLFNLQKKHRVTNNEELIALQHKLEKDVAQIGSLQSEISAKEKELETLQLGLTNAAKALSDKRTRSIPAIEKNINELLTQVEMPDARIKIEVVKTDFTETGTDHITLMFTANKGSAFQPISKVASGGELSRLMLCIKSLISDKVALPSIVFDEIDTGISGEAALKVSQVMKKHALQHQVIAITHLPQIAGKANAHFYVYKTSDNTSTNTHIKRLSEQERLEEIARMLHGANPSPKVLEAARELIG